MEVLKACPVCNSGTIESFLSCKDHFLTKEEFTIVKCLDCGFKFTNPRPENEKLGGYYKSPDYISHSNSRKGIFNNLYQQVRKYTIAQKCKMISQYTSGNKILDVGCASGEFLNYMKSRNWDTTGIEPDESVRKMALEIYGLKVYDESYLEEIPANSMDVITLWHVLEHVSDLQGRMKALHHILKPGGLLVMAVPNAACKDAQTYGEFWAGYDVPRHLYHFSRGSMEKLLNRFHFSLSAIKPMKFDSFYVSMLSEKYKTGKMSWTRGFWNGYCSNRAAVKSGDYSSLIYISKKEISN
jgi:predicted SAM-dependent methyltransferase